METKQYIESTGKVKYYTKWVLALCDPAIVDYYAWWCLRMKGIRLNKSKNGSHISIVRGEEDGILEGNWERDVTSLPEIKFYYSHGDLKQGLGYIWLDVHGSDLTKTRTDLGLSEKPHFGWHLTIGKIQ